ncbi:hypothetical protein [Saccharopolyspora endophytica]|uniref:Uncharacterized protein n=1 Tax=Saccharopolyspora endophytica TaxID=543886 RepID=A0ABS5DMK7_9PSEU|nr:hypothetical protein [Saccharopolyspora endophytica]MBQ0927537.1 hypothetical protein [Saccharopolyspora endophytica]
MTLETAPGGPGRAELMCVGSTGGLSIHLLDPVAQEVLCRGLRTDTVRMGPGLAPFELNGCARCASSASDRGYDVVVGYDGAHVPLPGFQPVSAG